MLPLILQIIFNFHTPKERMGGGLLIHGRNQHKLYHPAGHHVEPTRKEIKRTSMEYTEKGSPDRHKEDRLQLEGT